QRGKQHVADAGGGAVDPAQPRRLADLLRTQACGERHVGVGNPVERLLVVVRAHERVLREVTPQSGDVRLRNAPDVELAVERDEDLHFVFFTRRIAPITIVLSIAFTMSYIVSAATATAVSASISTPVGPVVLAVASIA